jgi:hypothetical protein
MYAAFPSQPENGGFAAPLPRNGLVSGKLVLANPVLGNDPSGHLLNATAISNNIAMIQYGAGPSYQALVTEAQTAGAVACVIYDQAANSGNPPTDMSGTTGSVNIPAVMISYDDGVSLTNYVKNIQINLGDDGSSLRLGEYDGLRGASDTPFYVYAPASGVYPIRIVYEQGYGGASVEFSQILNNGTHVLINDVADGGLPSYSSVVPPPLMSGCQYLTNGGFQIQFCGTVGRAYTLLASTNLVNWTPVLNFSCTNAPMCVVDPGAKCFGWRFYRAVMQ